MLMMRIQSTAKCKKLHSDYRDGSFEVFAKRLSAVLIFVYLTRASRNCLLQSQISSALQITDIAYYIMFPLIQ